MLVYRVEDINGTGMYYAGSSACADMQDIDDEGCRHPHPRDDSALSRALMEGNVSNTWVPSCFNYGFSSVDQLKRWIYMDAWRTSLQEEGFSISVYECIRDCFYGDTQAVFIKEHATKVNTLQLTEV